MNTEKKRSSKQSEAGKKVSSRNYINYSFRKYPALKIAYKEAFRRFSELPGVCGLGIGRKFKEKKWRYAPESKTHGGLCIKIFLRKKCKPEELSKKNNIPKYLVILMPDGVTKTRVLLDIEEIGQPYLAYPAETLAHDWPTAGCINVGRIFSFGHKTVIDNDGSFKKGEAELGTVGCVIIKIEDGTQWATSAGHVFINMIDDNYDAPAGPRALGIYDRGWVKIPAESFRPESTRENNYITDAYLFKVPEEYVSRRVSWPTEFDGQFATNEDIDAAIHDEHTNGFIWVERIGANNEIQKIPIDLMADMQSLSINIKGVQMTYGFTWKYRFTEGFKTIGGDSGSSVFIYSKDRKKARLLGFHFLHDSAIGYAVSGKVFFYGLSLIPGQNFNFKGFENIG